MRKLEQILSEVRYRESLWSRLLLLFLLATIGSTNVQAQQPVAEFSANQTSGCAPLSVRFTDQSTGTPQFWNWDLGNGQLSNLQNPVATYNTPGTYSVTLVVRNQNGVDAETKTAYITVFPSPVARFSANRRETCLGTAIQFTDNSTDPAGTIVSWLWNFGDGTTSTQQNPTKSYSENGFYNVSLTVTSSTGCRNTSSSARFIRIFSGIANAFTVEKDSSCIAPFRVRLRNETTGPGALAYQWDFGNGTSSGLQNPTALYNSPGQYTITLRTISSFGCTEVSQQTINLTEESFNIGGPANVCLNSTETFQFNGSGNPDSLRWILPDTTATGNAFSNRFNTLGNTPIKLIAYYGSCIDSVQENILVNPLPSVTFNPTASRFCSAPRTINFTANSTTAVAWNWNFGNGTTSALPNPSAIYNNQGNFQVSLTVTDQNGCRNTATVPNAVIITPPVLVPNSISAEGCVPFVYQPNPIVNTVDPIVSYAWDFGDGTTGTGRNPVKTYPNPGNYSVRLTVTTAGGCTESFLVNNAVQTGNLPGTSFTTSLTNACVEQAIQFTNTSVQSDEWIWDFGDGTSSNEENPLHAYAQPGVYTVRLTAINNGCAQSFTFPTPITVLPPRAFFGYTSNCADIFSIQFINQSFTDPTLGAVTYFWQFGDPGNNTSTDPNPNFRYPALGDYTVSLTVTNGTCSHTFNAIVRVVQEPADFQASSTMVCRNAPVTFTPVNSDPTLISNYAWFVNGNLAASTREFTTSFPNNGQYSITFRFTDINGCVYESTNTNMIEVTGPQAGFSALEEGNCVGAPIRFESNATGNNLSYAYIWGDRTRSEPSPANTTHAYTVRGSYLPQQIVTDAMGCRDTFQLPTAVLATQPVADFTVRDTLFCPGGTTTFQNRSEGVGLTYAWDVGLAGTSTEENPAFVFPSSDAQYNVQLRVTDRFGCTAEKTENNAIRIVVPRGEIQVSDSTFLCAPSEVFFSSTTSGVSAISWDFDNGNFSSQQNPVQFFNDFRTYTVRLLLTGFGGCVEEVIQPIRVVNPNSARIALSPVTNCNEITTQFELTVPSDIAFIFNFGDGSRDSSGRTSFSHYYGAPNFYAPSISLSDRTGCLATVGAPSVVRVIGALPVFGLSTDRFCDEGTVAFTNFTIGNDPVVNTQWNFGDNQTSTELNPVHFFAQPGLYPVSLTVTTQSGCSRTFIDTVSVFRTPTPIVPADLEICSGVNLPISGALAVADTSITWRWQLSTGEQLTGRDINVRFNNPGTVTATATATNLLGCSSSASQSITVFPLPNINVIEPIVTTSGRPITLPVSYSNNVNVYNWESNPELSCTNCPQPTASPRFSTTYRVQATDENGCIANRDIRVEVVCNTSNFFIPNTFSPNGDGSNDLFYPRGTGIERIASMRIFSRWGQLVFEKRNFAANDPSTAWDGKINGKAAEAGTYVYVVELICENASVIPFKGNITLIR